MQSQVETKLKHANVEIHAVPAKNVQDNVMWGNFDMYLSLWLSDYSDPMSDMDVLQSNNYQNHGRYNSADYDRYIKAAKSKSAEETDHYWENMRNAQNQLTKDTAAVPLYNMTESHLARKNLRGVLWHPVGEVDYTRAYFD